MKRKNNHAATEVHNLIILDRSGSMSSIAPQAIAGVNETVGTIRAVGKKTGMSQFVTITTFCGCSTTDFCSGIPAADVPAMTERDYQPCCSTPLYDAMGTALTALRESLQGKTDVAVSVTIITDGYENASTHWNGNSIRALVELLKADGWLFAYIGANQDVNQVSFTLSIDNALAFQATPEGTAKMFRKENIARCRWTQRVSEGELCCNSADYFSASDE